jgi:hypothetical protein
MTITGKIQKFELRKQAGSATAIDSWLFISRPPLKSKSSTLGA